MLRVIQTTKGKDILFLTQCLLVLCHKSQNICILLRVHLLLWNWSQSVHSFTEGSELKFSSLTYKEGLFFRFHIYFTLS